jgi:hypothetical protein
MSPQKEERLRAEAQRLMRKLAKLKQQLRPSRPVVRSDKPRGRPSVTAKVAVAKIYVEEGLPLNVAAMKAGVGRSTLYDHGISRENIERAKLAAAK